MNLRSTILAPFFSANLSDLSWSHGRSSIALLCCGLLDSEVDCAALERVFAALAGADADDFFDRA